MDNKIYAEIRKDYIDLYVTCLEAKNQSYVKYRLSHIVKPFTDGKIMQNQDLWRLWELYTYEFRDGKMVQSLPYKVMSAGEWECALKIVGTPDFHGGFHGYEHIIYVSARADGKPVSTDEQRDLWTDRFEFTQVSRIVKQGTKDELVAYHTKRYLFENGEMTINQELSWATDCEIQFGYMAMLPIRRTHDDTPTGEQISDHIMINDDPTVYDVTKAGHMTPVSSQKNLASGVHRAKIWGETSGLVAEVSIDGDMRESATFMVQNNETYNKLYFSHAGGGNGYNIQSGEKWHCQSKYKIYMTK